MNDGKPCPHCGAPPLVQRATSYGSAPVLDLSKLIASPQVMKAAREEESGIHRSLEEMINEAIGAEFEENAVTGRHG